jgi:hypothetical protein
VTAVIVFVTRAREEGNDTNMKAPEDCFEVTRTRSVRREN